MTVDEIWLTEAASAAFSALAAGSPAQAAAVGDAISGIPSRPGRGIDIPGSPPGAPFLASEPADPAAPVVIYRRATAAERGAWLVVQLMGRDDYRAFREAEMKVITAPPEIRQQVTAILETAAARGGQPPAGADAS